MKLRKTDTEWPLRVLYAAAQVTAWAVTWRMIDALEAAPDGDKAVERTGDDDGYNWSVALYEKDGQWVISGGCGYGSGGSCGPSWLEVNTCGGHSITATRLPDGGTVFETDQHDSYQSWGELESVYGEYRVDPECEFADYSPEQIERHRVGLLREQFEKEES